MARMPGLSGGLPLVYIVYSRKKYVAYASDPRPTFLFVSLLGAGKKSTCVKRGWHRIGGGRTRWLGKAAQPQKPHGALPGAGLFQ